MKGKSWWTPLRSGLILDPKHRKGIGPAIWLLMYCLMYADRKTGKLNRKILTIASELKTTEKTIQRWMRILEHHGYIKTRRLWHGYQIEITKWRPLGGHKLSDNNVQPLGKESSDNPTPVIGQKMDSGRTLSYQPVNSVQSLSCEKEKVNSGSSDRNVRNKKSLYKDSSKTKGMIDDFSNTKSEKEWDKVKKSLSTNQEIISENYDTYLAPTKGLVMKKDRVVVGVPNRFIQMCLSKNYTDEIQKALREAGGFDPPPKPEFTII